MKNGLSWISPGPALCLIGLLSCVSCKGGSYEGIDFRQEMRDFVREISTHARSENPLFIVLPQNGLELASLSGEPDGALATDYLNAVDGCGREDVYYGYSGDGIATQAEISDYFTSYCDLFLKAGKTVLVIDYCSLTIQVDDSYTKSGQKGYLSFAADRRSLDDIPAYPSTPHGRNANNIEKMADAHNFLYLINPANFDGADSLVAAVAQTDYDLVVLDLFLNDGGDGVISLSASDIEKMRAKKSGGSRLLICYMSIGEAEDYRYYWKGGWKRGKPSWLVEENPDWEGNYKVAFWEEGWKDIILGSEAGYLNKILAAGFDGVYLDIIDAFEYFEELSE